MSSTLLTDEGAYDEALLRIDLCRQDKGVKLDLSGLGLSELPPEIEELTDLIDLDLSGNQFCDAVTEVERSMRLHLDYFEPKLPDKIAHLTKLQILNLSKNQLTDIPSEIWELTGLRKLHLGDNQISSLSPEIEQLTELNDLDLGRNQIRNLPPEIWHLTNLKKLYLGDNQIRSLSPSIGQLTSLRELYLGGNQLNALPTEIALIVGLNKLDLSRNQLRGMPPEVWLLAALKDLHVDDNQIRSLQSGIGRLTNLKRLDLSRNQLDSLPQQLWELPALTELYLCDNQLRAVSPEIGRLNNLKRLDISRNQIGVLSPQVWQVTSLVELNLGGNQLRSLPSGVGRLSNLKKMYLSRNQLSSLPPGIGQLSSLTELDISCNNLSSLPLEMGQLAMLSELVLSSNQLINLPSSLRSLFQLKELFLHNNPELKIPEEILGQGISPFRAMHRNSKLRSRTNPSEILDYYFSISGDQGRALREVKVILVGRGEVGKTTMVDTLRSKPFVDERPRTDGIAITPWEVTLPDGKATLTFWDFGGQEIMHGTHQFFMTHRSLYVVVVDGRHDRAQQDAEYWLKLVRAFGGESPVMVVMNRQMTHAFDLDRQALTQKYDLDLEHFYRTECSRSESLVPLREAIYKEAGRMLSSEELFPVACWELKERLAQMKAHGENYLSEEDYRNVCQDYSLQDPVQQQKLLLRLADLGTVVSFPEDVRLAHLSVLNPEWATDGIYCIITNDTLKDDGHGTLKMDRMRELLPQDRWPQMQHIRYVADLMSKFELCFPVEDGAGSLLIPELLPDQTPALGDWDPAACLVFQYTYPVLPHGLLPRLITRTHEMSKGQQRWRKGGILVGEDAQARLQADYDANTITLWVRGKHPQMRRSLLAVIRQHFHALHARYPDLNALERVAVPGHPEVLLSYRALLLSEQRGNRTFPVTKNEDKPNERSWDWPLAELLNGVETSEEREAARIPKEGASVVQNFYDCDIDQSDRRDQRNESIIARDIINSQVGQTLRDCQNIIQEAPWEDGRREPLEKLQKAVEEVVRKVGAETEEAKKLTGRLKRFVEESMKPASEVEEAHWALSSKGLLDASQFAANIAAVAQPLVAAVGKALGLG